jgi:hypothetical protein
MKQQTTTKKVKCIGTEQYINARTGELEEMQVTTIEERDYNFKKIWMKNFIATLDIIGNQKTKFCYWLIDHVNADNMVVGTQRQLSDQSGISLQTVNITLKLLMDADFLRKKCSGVYIINPAIVFSGRHNSRMNVMNQYMASERVELTTREKLDNILDSIQRLQTQAKDLQDKLQKEQITQISGQMEIIDADMHVKEA